MRDLAAGGHGLILILVRAARDPRHERPHRRDARRHGRRDPVARGGDAAGRSSPWRSGPTSGVERVKRPHAESRRGARARSRSRRAGRRCARVLCARQPPRYLSRQRCRCSIVAIGATLVILTGQIDISVGSVFAVCGVVAGVLAKAGVAGAAGGRSARALPAPRSAPSTARWSPTPHPVDRRHAGDDGGAARWAALGDAGRMGAGSARRRSSGSDSQARVSDGGRRGDRWRSSRRRRGACATGGGPRGLRDRLESRARHGWRASTRALVVFSVFVAAGALTGLAALLNAVRFNQIPSNSRPRARDEGDRGGGRGRRRDHRRTGTPRRHAARRRAARRDRARR